MRDDEGLAPRKSEAEAERRGIFSPVHWKFRYEKKKVIGRRSDFHGSVSSEREGYTSRLGDVPIHGNFIVAENGTVPGGRQPLF